MDQIGTQAHRHTGTQAEGHTGRGAHVHTGREAEMRAIAQAGRQVGAHWAGMAWQSMAREGIHHVA